MWLKIKRSEGQTAGFGNHVSTQRSGNPFWNSGFRFATATWKHRAHWVYQVEDLRRTNSELGAKACIAVAPPDWCSSKWCYVSRTGHAPHIFHLLKHVFVFPPLGFKGNLSLPEIMFSQGGLSKGCSNTCSYFPVLVLPFFFGRGLEQKWKSSSLVGVEPSEADHPALETAPSKLSRSCQVTSEPSTTYPELAWSYATCGYRDMFSKYNITESAQGQPMRVTSLCLRMRSFSLVGFKERLSYWICFNFFPRGLKQMEGDVPEQHRRLEGELLHQHAGQGGRDRKRSDGIRWKCLFFTTTTWG